MRREIGTEMRYNAVPDIQEMETTIMVRILKRRQYSFSRSVSLLFFLIGFCSLSLAAMDISDS